MKKVLSKTYISYIMLSKIDETKHRNEINFKSQLGFEKSKTLFVKTIWNLESLGNGVVIDLL